MSQFSSHAHEADPLFRREMRERWRRPLTLLQLAVFAGALAWLGYQIYGTMVPQSEFADFNALRGLGRAFFFTVAKWHALAWIPGGLLLAAPTLSAEIERGHLTDWVLAGLRPAGIVRAKFRALAGFVLVMACVPFPVLALCFPLGGVSPLDFLAVFALTVAIALNSVALGIAISANSATVISALTRALFLSAFVLFVAVLLFPTFFGESWLGPLTLALTIGWLPAIWIAAAETTFEIAVERHIKDDEIRFEASLTNAPPPTVVTPRGHIMPPVGESASPPSSPPIVESRLQTDKATENKAMTVEAFSQAETLMLRTAQGNAIAHRDVRRRIEKRRAGGQEHEKMAGDAPLPLVVWVVLWTLVGLLGLWINVGAPDSGLFQTLTFLVLTSAMVFVALGAAPGFTRERAQKMLSALQMTALSPLDIVWGKIAGVLLLCAQFFGGLLLALALTAGAYGPRSVLMTVVFGISCAVFTAMGSLTLSLWSRKTEIVALGALAAIAALWWVVPTLYIDNNFSLFFHAPPWLEMLWLAPIRVFLEPASDRQLAVALLQLAVLCLLATLFMGALCVRQLRRTRDEEAGLFQRDLSRGLR